MICGGHGRGAGLRCCGTVPLSCSAGWAGEIGMEGGSEGGRKDGDREADGDWMFSGKNASNGSGFSVALGG